VAIRDLFKWLLRTSNTTPNLNADGKSGHLGVGGIYNETPPTLTDTLPGDLQLNPIGDLKTTLDGEEITTLDNQVRQIMSDILTELKIQNAYFHIIVDEKLTEEDIED